MDVTIKKENETEKERKEKKKRERKLPYCPVTALPDNQGRVEVERGRRGLNKEINFSLKALKEEGTCEWLFKWHH